MKLLSMMLLVPAMTAPAQAGGDVIEMKNGDRISGTIVPKPAECREKSDFRYLANFGYEF